MQCRLSCLVFRRGAVQSTPSDEGYKSRYSGMANRVLFMPPRPSIATRRRLDQGHHSVRASKGDGLIVFDHEWSAGNERAQPAIQVRKQRFGHGIEHPSLQRWSLFIPEKFVEHTDPTSRFQHPHSFPHPLFRLRHDRKNQVQQHRIE